MAKSASVRFGSESTDDAVLLPQTVSQSWFVGEKMLTPGGMSASTLADAVDEPLPTTLLL